MAHDPVKQLAQEAWALAARLTAAFTSSGGGTWVDRESPVVVAGPPTTLTLAQIPMSDACITVWRGAADGWAMTTAWTRAGAVITLTSPRVDVNELFMVTYRV